MHGMGDGTNVLAWLLIGAMWFLDDETPVWTKLALTALACATIWK